MKNLDLWRLLPMTGQVNYGKFGHCIVLGPLKKHVSMSALQRASDVVVMHQLYTQIRDLAVQGYTARIFSAHTR